MAVACGYSFSAVVGEDGSLFSFGANEHGQLGTGGNPQMLSPSKVAELPAPVRQVAAGSRHTGIVTEAGDLLMCGCGEDGRVGLDDEEDWAKPKKVQDNVLMVACGYVDTVTVTTSGDVYTFGYGENGQLGHGDTTNRFLPCLVPRSSFNNESVVMVAIGDDHTVALGQSGQVFTWGYGGYGSLGHCSFDNEMKPKQVQSQYFKDEKVVFVAASGCQTSAVTVNGKLYTWGYGQLGQLGLGNTFRCNVPTEVRVDRSESGRDRRVVMVACGSFHSLVVTEDGALWACGLGNSGQLGLDSNINRLFFELMDAGVFGNKKVVTAAAGHSHSAAVTEDGALWTWGRGIQGGLGHGNEESQPQPKKMDLLDNMRIMRCRKLSNEASSWPMGLTKREEGLRRLLGGGLTPSDMWPEPEAGQETQPAISTMLRAHVKVCKPCRVSVSAQNL
jgi:alpha-tubulin suppressor-like RCC1 family protein